jgi:hypothetical protein
MRVLVPLSRRPLDLVLVGFFAFNLLFVSYVISLEQIAIADPASGLLPVWPPGPAVAIVHWWEQNFDPLLWARPPWYRATIWIDVLLFGPFYAAAIYAFARGREWIRTPGLVWAGMMLSNVIIILFEEFVGPHAAPRPMVALGANASWLLFPLLVIWRVSRRELRFTEEVAATGP